MELPTSGRAESGCHTAARAFRSVPRAELLARLRDDTDRLLGEFEAVSDDEWSGLVIPDPYMGPLPVMIIAADTSAVVTPYAMGIRTTGHNGGDTRVEVSGEGVEFSAATIEDCPAILELDPASLVLSAYNRVNTGTVRGDLRVAAEFRSLFIAI